MRRQLFQLHVVEHFHYSAGHLRPSKKPAKTKAKPNTTATYGNDVEGEEPPE